MRGELGLPTEAVSCVGSEGDGWVASGNCLQKSVAALAAASLRGEACAPPHPPYAFPMLGCFCSGANTGTTCARINAASTCL